MIAAGMLYTMAVSLLLLAAATGAEYVARALRAPTRIGWVLAMVAALGLSGRALLRQPEAPPRQDSAAGTTGLSFQLDTSDAGGVAPSPAATPVPKAQSASSAVVSVNLS